MKYLVIIMLTLLTLLAMSCTSPSGQLAKRRLSHVDSVRTTDSLIEQAIHLMAETSPETYSTTNDTENDENRHMVCEHDVYCYSIGEQSGIQIVTTDDNELAVRVMRQLDYVHAHYEMHKDNGMWYLKWSDKIYVPFTKSGN